MNKEWLSISVVVRKPNRELYTTKSGHKTVRFDFQHPDSGENLVELVMRRTAEEYLSISKEGSIVQLTARQWSEMTQTWSEKYVYYADENRFIISE